MPPTINVQFRNAGLGDGSMRVPLKRFAERILAPCLQEHGFAHGEVTVLFSGTVYIRALNLQYRAIDKPTDVLSFPFSDDLEASRRAPQAYLGDVALCLAVCQEQAPDNGRCLADEVALLLVHGFLHLVGYDHDTKPKEKAMWKETDRLLAISAGVARPELRTREVGA